ncbi:MAG: TrmH family RNA methyltransferase [Erysipelotrichia bacterium]|nr:TrmH family RNA methyltransferase [Erysipelotrichia bacterium]
MRKYKKEDELSYSLGTELTLELLLQHPQDVIRVYVHSKQKDNPIYNRIKVLCDKYQKEIVQNDKIFNILSDKDNCYIIGLFKKYVSEIDRNANHLVLVNPSNMGNLGTIIRTSLGFGINNLVLIRPAVDIYDPKCIRASMGAFFELNFEYFDSFEQYLSSVSKREIFPFMLDGAKQLEEIEIPERYSLVFGNEATGLPSDFHRYGQSVFIKHLHTIDSLNLTNAVSIGLYQFTLRRI